MKVTKYDRDWSYSFEKDGKTIELTRYYFDLDGQPVYWDRKTGSPAPKIGEELEGELTGKKDKNGTPQFKPTRLVECPECGHKFNPWDKQQKLPVEIKEEPKEEEPLDDLPF